MSLFISNNKSSLYSKRLILIGALLISVFIGLNGIITAYFLKKTVISSSSNQYSTISLVLSKHANQIFAFAKLALDDITLSVESSHPKNEAAYINFASTKSSFSMLRDKVGSGKILDVASLLDANGKVINFSRSYPPPLVDLSTRDYFIFFKNTNSKEVFISKPVLNKGTGTWTFYLSKRINDDQENFLGVAIVGISSEIFSRAYSDLGEKLGEGAALVLFRKDKVLLARWPFVDELIGTQFPAETIDKAVEATAGGNTLITDTPTSLRGNVPVDRMLSFRQTEDFPLLVGAVIPKEGYLDGLGKHLTILTAATLTTILVVVLFAVYPLLFSNKFRSALFASLNDPLTDLPNRVLLEDRIGQAITLSKRDNKKVALLFIAIDDFNKIHEAYGRSICKLLIQSVANRLLTGIRATDTLARIGDNEFALLMPTIDSEEDAIRLANKALNLLSAEFQLDDNSIYIKASVGISINENHSANADDLLQGAEQAMNQSKALGGNQVSIYEPQLP